MSLDFLSVCLIATHVTLLFTLLRIRQLERQVSRVKQFSVNEYDLQLTYAQIRADIEAAGRLN